MAKTFPRIYSLSTVGIQHHYHSDYIFHPFRTDFSGDSGVGKSMIADMLQLIFVGNEFVSATIGTDDRLIKTMPIGRYGYVFVNVEVGKGQYVVLGMFISTATNSPDPFIIQGGYSKDSFNPISNAISSKEILNDDIVEDLDNLIRRLDGQFACYKYSQNAYHDYLMTNELLPIQITDKTRLTNYARILRSFSRGKDFKHDSESLKKFFFDDMKENKIFEDFQSRIDDIEADLEGQKRNKETILKVSIKQRELIELNKLRQEKKEAEIELYKAKSIYHYRNISNCNDLINRKQRELLNSLTSIVKYRISSLVKSIKTLDEIFDKINTQRSTLNEVDVKLKEINDIDTILKLKSEEITVELKKYNLIDQNYDGNITKQVDKLYDEIVLVEKWIEKYFTIENIKKIYYEQNKNLEKRIKINDLEIFLKKYDLLDVFTSAKWLSDGDIEENYKNEINEIENAIKNLEALSKFSDIENPFSLSSWALKNNRCLSLEQESLLVHFKDLAINKPQIYNEGDKYLPVPEDLFDHIDKKDDDEKGFFINLNGIREYISYSKTQFFNTQDFDQLKMYFTDNYKKSIDEIENLNKKKNQIESLKQVINKVGVETITTYRDKKNIFEYKIDKEFEKLNVDLFEIYCSHYFFEDIIKKWKLEIDDYTTKINNKNSIKSQLNLELDIVRKFLQANDIIFEEEIEQLRTALTTLEILKIDEKRDVLNKLERYKKIKTVPDYFSNKNESIEIANRIIAKKIIREQKKQLEKNNNAYVTNKLKFESLANYELEVELEKYLNKYENPSDYELNLNTIRSSYKIHYNDIVTKYITDENQSRFLDSDSFLVLCKEILPDIFTHRIVNNETDVLEQIKDYLIEISNKYSEFSDVKLNILKEIFIQVREASYGYLSEISEISNYFSQNDCQISQGVKLELKHSYSDIYPIDWIDKFIEIIEEKAMHTGLFELIGNKIGIEEMMKEAYFQSGGKAKKIDIKQLLNPKSYFNIDFKMKKNDGSINSGSTGQTFAAIALICIARLSLIEKRERGNKLPKGLRIMPIDETENIGSNFKMLEKIASEHDYQLVVISRHPLDDDNNAGRYQYLLNGQINGDKIGTFAIFSEDSEVVLYSGDLN